MLSTAGRTAYDSDLDLFRDQVRKVFDKELYPHLDRWEEQGIVDRDFWKAYGAAGLLCPQVPVEYGGLGLDYRYNAVIGEELSYAGSSAGVTLQSDITVDYIINYGSEEQKQRLLPGMVSGEIITAIAMTEPGMGSDLKAVKTTARRDGSDWIVNGAKTFISNGQNCGLVIVVCKTDPGAGRKGISLICVEEGTKGFVKGRNLEKIGLHAADTSELFFEDVRVPAENLLGEENAGFSYLIRNLPQERLVIAIRAAASMEAMLQKTIEYAKDRKAFGQTVFDFQHNRFKLAELRANATMFRVFVDHCLALHMNGGLTIEMAAMAKLTGTEMQNRLLDDCLQMHGGNGYMADYEIGRAWADARVGRIYGGSSEIMKEIIARTL